MSWTGKQVTNSDACHIALPRKCNTLPHLGFGDSLQSLVYSLGLRFKVEKGSDTLQSVV